MRGVSRASGSNLEASRRPPRDRVVARSCRARRRRAHRRSQPPSRRPPQIRWHERKRRPAALAQRQPKTLAQRQPKRRRRRQAQKGGPRRRQRRRDRRTCRLPTSAASVRPRRSGERRATISSRCRRRGPLPERMGKHRRRSVEERGKPRASLVSSPRPGAHASALRAPAASPHAAPLLSPGNRPRRW